MIGRVPRHTSLGDGIDPNGLFVFIPGAIASGFLISLGLLAGDAYRGVRGDSGNQRRIRNSGAVVADEIRDGAGAGRRASHGLRRSAVYGVVGLASFGLVTLGIPGATWNFFNPVGYISCGLPWAGYRRTVRRRQRIRTTQGRSHRSWSRGRGGGRGLCLARPRNSQRR